MPFAIFFGIAGLIGLFFGEVIADFTVGEEPQTVLICNATFGPTCPSKLPPRTVTASHPEIGDKTLADAQRPNFIVRWVARGVGFVFLGITIFLFRRTESADGANR